MHQNYEELSPVIKIILALSHRQSAVERSFSLGKSFIVENILEEFVRNKKLIKDYMLANNITPNTIPITKKMQTDYTKVLGLSMKYTWNEKREEQNRKR